MLCWKRNRVRGPCNEVRVIELVLCVVCTVLSFYFMQYATMLRAVSLTLFCGIAFVVILLIDVIVICAWFPIGWRAWMMLALTASLYYFTCTGLSFMIYHKIFFVGTIFYAITAIVFLMDSMFIICMVQGCEEGRPCPMACKSSQVVPLNRTDPSVCTYTTASGSQSYPASILSSSYAGRSHATGSRSRVSSRSRSPRSSRTSRYSRQVPTVTHGGTFHVSKDAVPIPGPEPVAKNISLNDEHDTFSIEEEIAKKVRSVALMTKMAPKKMEEVDLTPLKSPFHVQEIPPRRPLKKLKTMPFSAYAETSFRQAFTTSPVRTINDNDGNNQQLISNNKI